MGHVEDVAGSWGAPTVILPTGNEAASRRFRINHLDHRPILRRRRDIPPPIQRHDGPRRRVDAEDAAVRFLVGREVRIADRDYLDLLALQNAADLGEAVGHRGFSTSMMSATTVRYPSRLKSPHSRM